MRRARGYTTVELIAVMVIIGVVAAFGIPRLMDDGNSTDAYAIEVTSALRSAQKSALAHRRLVCLEFGARTLTLNVASSNPAPSTGCNSVLQGPDVNGYASKDTNLTTSLALRSSGGASLPPQSTLYFQPDGSLSADVAGTLPVSATVTISVPNAAQRQVLIDGTTGHVQ